MEAVALGVAKIDGLHGDVEFGPAPRRPLGDVDPLRRPAARIARCLPGVEGSQLAVAPLERLGHHTTDCVREAPRVGDLALAADVGRTLAHVVENAAHPTLVGERLPRHQILENVVSYSFAILTIMDA